MSKLLCCMINSQVLDRAEYLMVMDIIMACVTTNYGCVDLVTKHGFLTWCLAIIDKEKVDKANPQAKPAELRAAMSWKAEGCH